MCEALLAANGEHAGHLVIENPKQQQQQRHRADVRTGHVPALFAGGAGDTPPVQQMAKAVNNATEQSLVLIDEFGKGTNSVRAGTR